MTMVSLDTCIVKRALLTVHGHSWTSNKVDAPRDQRNTHLYIMKKCTLDCALNKQILKVDLSNYIPSFLKLSGNTAYHFPLFVVCHKEAENGETCHTKVQEIAFYKLGLGRA